MSAWIVSRAHIDVLVHAAGVREMLPGHPDLVGQMLWQENFDSVNSRYDESEVCPPYSFTRPPVTWSPSQLLAHTSAATPTSPASTGAGSQVGPTP